MDQASRMRVVSRYIMTTSGEQSVMIIGASGRLMLFVRCSISLGPSMWVTLVQETNPFPFGWIMSSVAVMSKVSLLVVTEAGEIMTVSMILMQELCAEMTLFHQLKVNENNFLTERSRSVAVVSKLVLYFLKTQECGVIELR